MPKQHATLPQIPQVADFLETHLLEKIHIVGRQVGLLHADGFRAAANKAGCKLVQPIPECSPTKVLTLEVLQIQSYLDSFKVRLSEILPSRGARRKTQQQTQAQGRVPSRDPHGGGHKQAGWSIQQVSNR